MKETLARSASAKYQPTHSQANLMEVAWPTQWQPGRASVCVVNELHIPATPSVIWRHLVAPLEWPTFYSNASDIRFERGPGPLLERDSIFRWKTFGVRIRSEICEFEPNRLLSWIGSGLGLRAMHRWVLVAEGSGTRVTTTEIQFGFVPKLAGRFLRPGMLRQHDNWLIGLAAKATSSN